MRLSVLVKPVMYAFIAELIKIKNAISALKKILCGSAFFKENVKSFRFSKSIVAKAKRF